MQPAGKRRYDGRSTNRSITCDCSVAEPYIADILEISGYSGSQTPCQTTPMAGHYRRCLIHRPVILLLRLYM
jgi:hypothetical protein